LSWARSSIAPLSRLPCRSTCAPSRPSSDPRWRSIFYAWLTYEAYRANRNNKSRFVPWKKLHEQFGAEYFRMTDFQQKARAALAKIRAVYPGLVLGKTREG